jgi:hypothetical protein
VIQPSTRDVHGLLFATKGLQEYAQAAAEDQAHETAGGILKSFFEYVNKPDVRLHATLGNNILA